MNAPKTNEARKELYTRLYTIVSKATAEEKIYVGMLKNLFADVKASTNVLTRFMWVITHKTEAVPKPLFKLIDHGMKGIELQRLNSGFYMDQEGQRIHIYGIDLIPYIMAALTERRTFLIQTKSAKPVVQPVQAVQEIPKQEIKQETPKTPNRPQLRDLTTLSDKDLAEYGRLCDVYVQDALAKRSNYRAEIQRREDERKRKKTIRFAKEKVIDLLRTMGLNLNDLKDEINNE